MQLVRKVDLAIGPVFENGAKIMYVVFSAVALILCVAYQWRAVTFPYSLDYGEAPLVDQAMRLASGQNIYRADISTPPYTISNYPPLYVALLAVSVKLFGPASTFLVGRLLSLLCAWLSSVCIALILYTLTHDRFAGLIAGIIFLAFPYVVSWSPLLRIDMLALALSLGSLCLLVWQPESPSRFMAAAILMVASIYTRQSYLLAAPLASFVWLLSRDWRRAFRFAAIVGITVAGIFLLLNILTHGGFFFNIVTANANEFKLDRLHNFWDQFRKFALIFLLFGGFSFFLIRRWNPLWTLSAPYLFGAAISALTIGKIGSNVNYLLELCAAVSIAAGVVIAWSRAHLSIQSLRAVLVVLLAFAIGRLMHFTLSDFTGNLRDRHAALSELSKLENIVANAQGPVLADEYMGMLTLHGRPLAIQPFEMTQMSRDGSWDQTPLLDSIRENEYPAIIIYEPWSGERWTPEMRKVIDQSYRLAEDIGGNKVYMPWMQKQTSLTICPGALWRLPSDSTRGMQILDNGINFFGQGNERKIPVYAVADGLLVRAEDWTDAVAIQHDDPLHPGKKVWSYYNGMAAANGIDSYVSEDFPPGVTNVPVKAGQFLGYQGTWSGTPQWSMWVHVGFAIVDTDEQGLFPRKITSNLLVDPLAYLGLDVNNKNSQILECDQP